MEIIVNPSEVEDQRNNPKMDKNSTLTSISNSEEMIIPVSELSKEEEVYVPTSELSKEEEISISPEDITKEKLSNSIPDKSKEEFIDSKFSWTDKIKSLFNKEDSLEVKPKDSKIKEVSDYSKKSLEINEDKSSEDNMNAFQKTLDIIGRPGYAIKSLILEQQEFTKKIISDNNLDLSKPEDYKKYVSLNSSFRGKDKLESLWRGFSGEEKVTANELWDNIGVRGIPLLGFIGEIVTDPLQYGGYKAIGQGIRSGTKLAGQGIKSIPGIVETGKTIATKIEPVTSALKEMFAKTNIPKLADTIDKYLSKRQYMKAQEMEFGIKTRNIIQNISKKYAKPITDVEREVVNLIEQPGSVPEAANEIKVLANVMKGHLENIITKEMKAGVPITYLSQGDRAIEYFPRITGREADKYLKEAKKSFSGNSKIFDVMIKNAKKRKTADFTLAEFNDFVKEHGLESLGGRSVEQFFMQNPSAAVATRGIRSAKAVTSAEFLDEAGKLFGLKESPSWYEELPESITKLNPSLKGLKFDPEVANEITKTTGRYFNPQESGIFLESFDKIQNYWKGWVLAPFPKYHLRNLAGNLWNNHLADVNASSYNKAKSLQLYEKYKNTTGGLKDFSTSQLKRVGLNPSQADDIIRSAKETGVLNQGWYGSDIETAIDQALKGSKGVVATGMRVGTVIENNARLAHFVDKLDKGNDAMGAAISVKKYLFDYQDITSFERQIMKRLFPFYTWSRKNIPLQLKTIWEQPEKYAKLTPMLRNRDPQDMLRLKYARPDLYEKLPIEIKRDIDTVTYVPMEGLIPAADLTKMVRPQELMIEMLNPVLKFAVEASINKSFYSESEIERYDGETQELLRLDIPVRLKHAIVSVLPYSRMLNEINKIVKKQVNKEELSPAELAFSLSLSSIYKTNLKDLKDRATTSLNRRIEDLRSGAYTAKRMQRENEFNRIMKKYKEVREIMKSIK